MLKETLLKFFKLDGLMSNLTGYVETRIELMKVEIKDDVAKAISQMTLFIFVGAFLAIFIVFISVAIALFIGTSIGLYGGFLIVGAFYLLLTILLILFRRDISRIIELQIKKVLKNK